MNGAFCSRCEGVEDVGPSALAALHFTPATAPPGQRCRRPPPPTCRQQATLACRRFAALARSPLLLRKVEVWAYSLAAMRSLLAWMVRHSRHIRRLTFLGYVGDDEDAGICAAAVATCLAAASAAGQLEELTARSLMLHTKWLPLVRALRRLSLTAEALEVDSSDISFAAGARLPASITCLAVLSDENTEMPE